MEHEPTLKHLMDDLNGLIRSRNGRLIILQLQLYVEHYVNEIVSQLIDDPAKEIVKTNLEFPKKLKILKRMKILRRRTEYILIKLSTIRNLLVHNLTIQRKMIDEVLQDSELAFMYSWEIKDKHDAVKRYTVDLKKVYEHFPDKFGRLQISTAMIIGILYNALNVLKGKKTTQFLVVESLQRDSRWILNLKVIEIADKEL